DVLNAWVEALLIAQAEPDHPLNAFALVATASEKVDSAETLQRLLEPIRQRLTAREAAWAAAPDGARVIVDYAQLDPVQFLPDDASFGVRPVHVLDLVLGDRPEQPIAGVQRYGAA